MNYGDVAVNATVRFTFTTQAATGAAVAPSSAFEAADIRLYKGSSATDRSSQAGWTMTSPFDSITGLNHLTIASKPVLTIKTETTTRNSLRTKALPCWIASLVPTCDAAFTTTA